MSKEDRCVMGGKFEDSTEVSPCIFPNCKREMCYVYQLKILGIPVYENKENKE